MKVMGPASGGGGILPRVDLIFIVVVVVWRDLGAMVDAQHVVSCDCTSSNGFISGMVGWKFLFGQGDGVLLI